jgi:hypothetical protein
LLTLALILALTIVAVNYLSALSTYETAGSSGLGRFEILARCESVEGSMGTMMVVEMLEDIDVLGDFVDTGRQVDGCVEFVAPCAVASLDGALEFSAISAAGT